MTTRTKKRNQSNPLWIVLFGVAVLSAIVWLLLRGNDVILMNPKGMVAQEQHNLMVTSTLIMLAFGIPVVGLLYYFAWRYRENNNKAHYSSKSSQSKKFSLMLWIPPTIIMIILSVILVPSTFRLQPQKSLQSYSENEKLTIQVIGLRWKWLFVYPEQNIATVNFVQIPVDTPVEFLLTVDETPMSSFWIPHIGGMLYAMTEHVNRLNLIGEEIGDFEGSAAEINGYGFAGMRFNARVSSDADFDAWVAQTSASPMVLDQAEYNKLLEPSKENPVAYYSRPKPDLFASVVSKYAGSHQHASQEEEHTEH